MVNLRGAELVRLFTGGRELLWPGDVGSWARSSPVLFPVVGRLRHGTARFGTTVKAMPIHGFAPTSLFEVVDSGTEAVTLLLQSDDLTRACYPYDFELVVEYRLRPQELHMDLWLRNTSMHPMPWSLGLHPGFRWPWAGQGPEGHCLIFSEDESALVPVITPQGLFSDQHRPVPLEGQRLPLHRDLFAHEALCFLHARSKALRLQAPDGSCIDIEAEGFSHWALWSHPGAAFLCVEAWTSHGDLEDWDGDFADRPGTRWLAAGASTRLSQRIRYLGAEEQQ